MSNAPLDIRTILRDQISGVAKCDLDFINISNNEIDINMHYENSLIQIFGQYIVLSDEKLGTEFTIFLPSYEVTRKNNKLFLSYKTRYAYGYDIQIKFMNLKLAEEYREYFTSKEVFERKIITQSNFNTIKKFVYSCKFHYNDDDSSMQQEIHLSIEEESRSLILFDGNTNTTIDQISFLESENIFIDTFPQTGILPVLNIYIDGVLVHSLCMNGPFFDFFRVVISCLFQFQNDSIAIQQSIDENQAINLIDKGSTSGSHLNDTDSNENDNAANLLAQNTGTSYKRLFSEPKEIKFHFNHAPPETKPNLLLFNSNNKENVAAFTRERNDETRQTNLLKEQKAHITMISKREDSTPRKEKLLKKQTKTKQTNKETQNNELRDEDLSSEIEVSNWHNKIEKVKENQKEREQYQGALSNEFTEEDKYNLTIIFKITLHQTMIGDMADRFQKIYGEKVSFKERQFEFLSAFKEYMYEQIKTKTGFQTYNDFLNSFIDIQENSEFQSNFFISKLDEVSMLNESIISDNEKWFNKIQELIPDNESDNHIIYQKTIIVIDEIIEKIKSGSKFSEEKFFGFLDKNLQKETNINEATLFDFTQAIPEKTLKNFFVMVFENGFLSNCFLFFMNFMRINNLESFDFAENSIFNDQITMKKLYLSFQFLNNKFFGK